LYTHASMPEQYPDNENVPIPRLTRFKFGLVRRTLWLISKMVGLNGLYLGGKLFAQAEWLVGYKRRRRFHRQMKKLFGEKYNPKDMGRACRSQFIRTRCDKLFYLIFDLIPREKIVKRIHFPNRPILEDAFEKGRGVYVALAHCGAQHVAGLLMCFLGYKTAGVRDRHEGVLRRYIQERYAERFQEIRAAKIFYSDAFPRDLYRWFQGNGLLGSALDVERTRESHLKRFPVTFFGETQHFLVGTIQIALRCQAPVHQGFVISQPYFHYHLELLPALIDPDHSRDDPDTLQTIMQQYAKNIETHLCQYPDHLSRI